MEEKVNQLQGKTHVFLTGDRGAGKSWIARRAAEKTGRPCYGFVTRFSAGARQAAAGWGTGKAALLEITVCVAKNETTQGGSRDETDGQDL